MLLASEKGAGLIVSVGAHFNLVEFLDKARGGMSSTFLTRLRVGELLVDAKGVSRLYNPGVSGPQMALLLAALLILLAIVIAKTPALSDLVDLIWLKLKIIEAQAHPRHQLADGVLGALSRRLARRRLPGAGDRHPDRRRAGRQRRLGHDEAAREEPHQRPRRRPLQRRGPPGRAEPGA